MPQGTLRDSAGFIACPLPRSLPRLALTACAAATGRFRDRVTASLRLLQVSVGFFRRAFRHSPICPSGLAAQLTYRFLTAPLAASADLTLRTFTGLAPERALG